MPSQLHAQDVTQCKGTRWSTSKTKVSVVAAKHATIFAFLAMDCMLAEILIIWATLQCCSEHCNGSNSQQRLSQSTLYTASCTGDSAHT